MATFGEGKMGGKARRAGQQQREIIKKLRHVRETPYERRWREEEESFLEEEEKEEGGQSMRTATISSS